MKNTLFVQQSQRKARGDASMRDPSRTSRLPLSLSLPLSEALNSNFSPSQQPFGRPPLSVTSSQPSLESKSIYTKYTLRLRHFFLMPPPPPTPLFFLTASALKDLQVGRSGTKRDRGMRQCHPHRGDRLPVRLPRHQSHN